MLCWAWAVLELGCAIDLPRDDPGVRVRQCDVERKADTGAMWELPAAAALEGEEMRRYKGGFGGSSWWITMTTACS